MKRKILDILLFTLLIYSLIIVAFDWNYYDKFNYPEKAPENFNFIAKINSSDYVLNTYQDQLKKGILWDKDTIISYTLKKNERERIYQIMRKINIISYPNYFVPKTKRRIFPSDDYYFKSTFNNVELEIKWYENTESEQKKAKELMLFLHSIFENILKDEKVKNLPESKRFRL